MSSFNLSSHVQTLAQTHKMDQLEQEVHELREEVTILRAEVEKITNLVSSLAAQQKPQPLCMRPPQQQHQPLRVQLARQKAPQQLDTRNHAPKIPVDPIPMRYMDLLPELLRKKLVQTRVPPPVPERLPVGYRADLTCAFHQGAPGHDIGHCFALKKMVQKLIEVGLLFFEDLNPGMQNVSVPEQYERQPRQWAPQQLNPPKHAPRTKFDPIPIRYTEFLPTLLERNWVQIKAPLPIPKKLPTRFRADLSCVFHQGTPGHDVEGCYALKNAVQDLVEANILSLEEFEP